MENATQTKLFDGNSFRVTDKFFIDTKRHAFPLHKLIGNAEIKKKFIQAKYMTE